MLRYFGYFFLCLLVKLTCSWSKIWQIRIPWLPFKIHCVKSDEYWPLFVSYINAYKTGLKVKLEIGSSRPAAGARWRWPGCRSRSSLSAGGLWSAAETRMAGQRRKGSPDAGRDVRRRCWTVADASSPILGSVSAAPCCGCSASDIPKISTSISFVTYV